MGFEPVIVPVPPVPVPVPEFHKHGSTHYNTTWLATYQCIQDANGSPKKVDTIHKNTAAQACDITPHMHDTNSAS